MKHIRIFEEYMDIDQICKQYRIKNYTINPDGTVDVDGDVYLQNRELKTLPLRFGRVSGSFWCNNNELTSLEGCPKEVGGHFSCAHNQLTTLEGCPKEMSGSFWCYHNQLTTLEGCTKEMGGNFWYYDNPLPEEVLQLQDNQPYVHWMIKWHEDYSIFNLNGTFNKYRFDQMMIDLKEELG